MKKILLSVFFGFTSYIKVWEWNQKEWNPHLIYIFPFYAIQLNAVFFNDAFNMSLVYGD